jgi:hypothetical protein
MSWQLTITMREGKDHVLNFDTEEEATSGAGRSQQPARPAPATAASGHTIAERLVVKPADVRSAEASKWEPVVA